MRQLWWRRALQQRLGTLAAAALILWTAGTAIAASVATRRVSAQLLAERRGEARSIAARVDLALQDDLRQLDLIAAASAAGDDDAIAARVRGVRLGESVLRLGQDGEVRWAMAVDTGLPVKPVIARLPLSSAGRWHAEPSGIISTPAGRRTFLTLPARESDPQRGAVAAAIDPDGGAMRLLLSSYAGDPYRVVLADDAGTIVAASRPSASADRSAVEQFVAAAPVASGRWQLRVEQPRSEALAPVLSLRRILVGSSLLLLPFSVLAALATARSIRKPVLAMTAAAERLAHGELAAPLPPSGHDEIGRLAHALERLRLELQGDERRSVLLKRVIAAQEEERRRIARELHDQTTQQLSALAMQLDAAAAAHPEARPQLSKSYALVQSMIDDLHRVIYDLRPSVLDDLGLLPAIRSYAESHLAPKGITVNWELPESIPPLSPEATSNLFRVVQESLANVARHSRADMVMVACTVGDDAIVFEVEDDGIGFDPAEMARPRITGEGFGLLGMRERLALLGGTLEIESEPGSGTRVVTRLPLSPENDTGFRFTNLEKRHPVSGETTGRTSERL